MGQEESLALPGHQSSQDFVNIKSSLVLPLFPV